MHRGTWNEKLAWIILKRVRLPIPIFLTYNSENYFCISILLIVRRPAMCKLGKKQKIA